MAHPRMAYTTEEIIKSGSLTLSDEPNTYCVCKVQDESPTGNPYWVVQRTMKYNRPNGGIVTMSDFASKHANVESAREALQTITEHGE